MRNLALTVEYDGTEFSGFAQQPGERTVQGELSEAIGRVVGHEVALVGAGRTDAGAHARGQVVNFQTDHRIPAGRLPIAVNKTIASDILVRGAREVPMEFSARFSALSRRYRYTILQRKARSPFVGRYEMLEAKPLDVERMNRAAQALIGEHEFTAFTLEPVGSRSFRRVIFGASVTGASKLIRFDIEGTAFLRGMVRMITGALIEIGAGRRDEADLARMLDNAEAARATWVVPACGLCLMKVRYAEF
jgi:tRNA pseudouridine38-40 synthase